MRKEKVFRRILQEWEGVGFTWRKRGLSDGKEKGGITEEGVNSRMEKVGNIKEEGKMHQG